MLCFFNGSIPTVIECFLIRGSRREWIMNPAGKSYVCILHEYVQHALKKQPAYQFKEIGWITNFIF